MDYDRAAIQTVLDALNGRGNTTKAVAKIRELVEDWWRNGRDTHGMGFQDELATHARRIRLSWNLILQPDSPLRGAPLVRTYPLRHSALMSGAFVPFFYLIESPFRDNLARCGREGCGRYFLRGKRLAANGRQVRGNKLYCARRCGRLRASTISTKATRASAKAKKFEDVETAVRTLQGLRRPPADTKAWVSKRSGVSRVFISRHRLIPRPFK